MICSNCEGKWDHEGADDDVVGCVNLAEEKKEVQMWITEGAVQY